MMNAITETLSTDANPSTDGDAFLPFQMTETLGKLMDECHNDLSRSTSTTVLPYIKEYFSFAHLVMVLYSLTQVSGERAFMFRTGSLNSMGWKSTLGDIPLDQKFLNFSIRLPHTENIGLITKEVFQSLVTLVYNPYNWGYTNPITSQVCSLSFYNTNGSMIDVHDLQDVDGMIELGLPQSPEIDPPPRIITNITLEPGQTLTTSFILKGEGAAHISLNVYTSPAVVLTSKNSFTTYNIKETGVKPPEGAVVAYLSTKSEPLYDNYEKMVFLQEEMDDKENTTFFISER